MNDLPQTNFIKAYRLRPGMFGIKPIFDVVGEGSALVNETITKPWMVEGHTQGEGMRSCEAQAQRADHVL